MEQVKVMDFCAAVSRKGLRGSGISIGDKVLVIGTRPLPAKKSDPYLQRIYVLVLLVDDEGVKIPNTKVDEEDNGNRTYLVDPRCLEKLPEEDQVEMMKGLHND